MKQKVCFKNFSNLYLSHTHFLCVLYSSVRKSRSRWFAVISLSFPSYFYSILLFFVLHRLHHSHCHCHHHDKLGYDPGPYQFRTCGSDYLLIIFWYFLVLTISLIVFTRHMIILISNYLLYLSNYIWHNGPHIRWITTIYLGNFPFTRYSDEYWVKPCQMNFPRPHQLNSFHPQVDWNSPIWK